MLDSIEAAVKEIKTTAKEDQKLANQYYQEYQVIAKMEAPTEEDAAKASALKAKMDEAVAAGEAKLKQADAKSAEAIPFYTSESHYRKKAIEMADPVSMTHLRDYATSLYK